MLCILSTQNCDLLLLLEIVIRNCTNTIYEILFDVALAKHQHLYVTLTVIMALYYYLCSHCRNIMNLGAIYDKKGRILNVIKPSRIDRTTIYGDHVPQLNEGKLSKLINYGNF